MYQIGKDFLSGEHWNVDVLATNEGFISSIERRDIKQGAGNCLTVEIVNYRKLSEFSRIVQKRLEIHSPFNLEVFEPRKGIFIINEINVRFGGGIIFGALAGRDFVSYLVTHNKKYLRPVQEGIYSRYFEEIPIDNIPSKQFTC